MPVYKVQPGDTLSSIAQNFGTSVQALAQANGIEDPDNIFAGQTLEVPDGGASPQQPVVPSVEPGGGVSVEQLQALMPNHLDEATANEHLPHMLAAMQEFEINTRLRAAAWLGNIAVETNELLWLQELDSEDGIYLRNMDYYPYYGCGVIHLTWKENYQAAGDFLGEDLVGNPDRTKDLDVAWRIGGYFWRYMSGQGDLNILSDQGDFATTVLGVNGALPNPNNRGDARWWYYSTALEVLPEMIVVEAAVEPVTKHKEVTLRVSERGWLYRENTDPIEWAKAPDLAARELATDGEGWLYIA